MTRMDRLREIVGSAARDRRAPGVSEPRLPAAGVGRVSREQIAHVLGGVVEDGPDGPCTVVRRTYQPTHRYGRRLLGAYPGLSAGALDLLMGRRPEGGLTADADDRCRSRSVVYFDLETTGLSGGAGTVAFLVGLGWFEGAEFQTCQYFLSHLADESRVLQAVARLLSEADTIVTFNGRSFDGPVTETRFAFHRLSSPFGSLRHVDLLHPSRHIWKGEECRLVRLERDVLGLHRVGDVPGAEIPARYVGFLRSGDAGLLTPVFEHNRLDLVSLGLLTGLACRLVRDGVGGAGSASQALGLGRLYERIGWAGRAIDCYRRAAGLDRSIAGWSGRDDRGGGDEDDGRGDVDAEALTRLAGLYRRQRRHAEAADLWGRLLRLPGVSDRLRREASVALAVHHEHRVRDLATAERFAQAALLAEVHPRRREAAQHRLSRLGRKRGQTGRMLQDEYTG